MLLVKAGRRVLGWVLPVRAVLAIAIILSAPVLALYFEGHVPRAYRSDPATLTPELRFASHKVLSTLDKRLRGPIWMPARTESDAQVLQGLISGKRAAFETVYRRHNASMIRVASAILRNRASAEEIVQESWIAVLRNIGGFEGRSSLAGWIFTIVSNKAKTRVKRDGLSVSLDTSVGDDTFDDAFDGRGRWRDMPDLWDEMAPERIVDGRQILEHVSEAIDQLPPGQRAVLVLRGQQDLDAGEVCEILGITEGNMRVLLHRARLSLRKSLDQISG